MIKRPLCLMCLLFMAAIWLCDMWGLSGYRESSRIPGVRSCLDSGDCAVINGKLYQREEKDSFYIYYLKDVVLTYHSELYPIEQVKITYFPTTEEEPCPLGSSLYAVGTLLEVPLPSNPGQFNERAYYRARKVYYTMKAETLTRSGEGYSRYLEFLYQIRSVIKNGIQNITDENTAAIFSAMLLGDKSDMDRGVKTQFQMLGIAHILAISGLHLSILGMGLYHLLQKAGAGCRLGGAISVIFLISYGILTGGSVATIRALIMFILMTGARFVGRTYDLLSALSLAGILILMDSPGYLYDSSFLLSFGAILGIGVILPLMKEEKKGGSMKDGLLSGLAVWMAGTPVILYFFFELPVFGFLFNLLVLPTAGVVLVSGAAGAAAGCVSVPLGRALIFPGSLLLRVYQELGGVVQKLPGITWILGRPDIWKISVYYGALAGLLLFWKFGTVRKRKSRGVGKLRGSRWMAAVCFSLISLALFHWRSYETLTVTFLDVGQGDSAVMETPQGSCFLIDGGSSSEANVGTYRLLPFLKHQGISTIDYVMVSHTDEDHMNGIIEILEAIEKGQTSLKIENLLLPGWQDTNAQLEELAKKGEAAGCRVMYLNQGDWMKEGMLKIACLHPDKSLYGQEPNSGSQVFEVTYGECSVLFTGDVEGDGEKKVESLLAGERGGSYDILKVAHHGSKNSSKDSFLEKVRPQAAIISCGLGNSYGHPHKETIERLEKVGSQIFLTQEGGAVRACMDGKKTTIEKYRDRQYNRP